MILTTTATGVTDRQTVLHYVNAISDKLILVKYPGHASLCISSKEGLPKYYLNGPKGPDKMEQSPLVNALFSQCYEIDCNMPFVLSPIGAKAEEIKHYFELSYPGSSRDLSVSPVDEHIQVVYAAHACDPLYGRILVNPRLLPDIQIMHNFKQGLSRINAIYLSTMEEQSLLRVYSANRLIFANRFHTDSSEEMAYFIMLAVDQLKLNRQEMHFEYLGDAVKADEYKSLLKDYLPALHYAPHKLTKTEALPEEQRSAFEKDWFMSIVLQCV